MAELQRSVTSFRRQGSSGLVWDDKFLAGLRDLSQNQNQNQNQEAKANQNQQENERVEGREQRQSQSVGSTATLERSRSAAERPYRTVNVAATSKVKDPPSPKVVKVPAACGLCGFFGKPVAATHKSNPKSKKRR